MEQAKYNKDAAIEEMKERILIGFLDALREAVLVKSTDSISGEIEYLEPIIEDMEAIISIKGSWDREDLKNLIVARTG